MLTTGHKTTVSSVNLTFARLHKYLNKAVFFYANGVGLSWCTTFTTQTLLTLFFYLLFSLCELGVRVAAFMSTYKHFKQAQCCGRDAVLSEW